MSASAFPADSPLPVRIAVVVACWLFVGLLFFAQTWVLNAASAAPEPIAVVLFQNFAVFGLWALLTPLVLALGARFPLERGGAWLRAAAMHLVFSLAFAVLHVAAYATLARLVLPRAAAAPADQLLLGLAIITGATNVLLYWAVLIVGQALRYFRFYQDREARLNEARLKGLRRQLAALLRDSLDASHLHERSLAKELEFVQGYLDIQHALLGPRLRASVEAEPAAQPGMVPVMLLQTLVENAVRHGIAPSAAGGCVRLRAWRRDDRLRVEIIDDGQGADPQRAAGGIGLANTRARLTHLYGRDHRLEFNSEPGRGTHIHIDIPFRTEPVSGGRP
jgi:signal transduction histidine kinase